MLVSSRNVKILFQIFFPLFDFSREGLPITDYPTEVIRNDPMIIQQILEQY